MRVARLLLVVAAACTLLVAPAVASALPTAPRVDDLTVGLTVPWAIGGPRIEADGTLRSFPGEWPTIPFESIRLWDARTAWLNLEPRDDQWDFTRLDAFVAKAKARGVGDISLVLGGTPRWAAKQVRLTDAAWMGPGSASPPKRMGEWAEFVSTVATRYRGVVTSYEVLERAEQRHLLERHARAVAHLVRLAAERIRAADPRATVVASGFRMSKPSDVAKVAPWIDALRGAPIDSVSVNWYPDKSDDLTAIATVLPALNRRSAAAGIRGPVWVSELNVRRGTTLSAAQQRAAVAALTASIRSGGADRVYWYAWTDLGPPELMPLYPRTPAATAVGASVGTP